MKIYKCTVSYRYSSGGRGPVLCKVFFIEADEPATAFVKAQQETKNLYNVYPPRIEEFVMPYIDFSCTKEKVIRDYGEIAFKEAIKELVDSEIHKTSDGSKRTYL